MKAKTKFTRLWSILLVLVMVVGMLPTVALATGSTTATETADFSTDPTAALTLLNTYKNAGTEDSTWDSSTKTLTLNGVNFETTAATAVKLPAGTTIVLADGTTNTITGGNSTTEDTHGIKAKHSLSIKGTGTLNVTGGTAGDHSFGICTLDGDLVIFSGNVKAKGGEAKVSSNGLWAGKTSWEDPANLAIVGGVVEAEGGRVTNTDGVSSGIYANRYIFIRNAGTIVTATGGTAQNYSFGIYAYGGKVQLYGGTLTAASKGTRCINGTVNVNDSGFKTISFESNNGGTGDMEARTTAETYTLPENGFTALLGKKFKGWSVDGAKKAVGDNINVAANTTVKAVWEDITYAVTVTNGTASVSQAAAGTTVTLTANAASTGEVFDKWKVVSGDITLKDATSATTTFTMPAGDVSVKATYHTHSYGSVWKSDADKHWHECSCGDKSAEAVHTAGDWITDTPATAATAGTKHKECTACGYVMETGTIPATGYTVSFDANGGTGTMADVTGVSGTYTLPENGFTAPEGKQFKAWSVGGTEKAVGDKITVSADTTVKAVWENITYTVSFDSNGGTGTMTAQTGVLGDYTLPANGFTAPEGKQFKGWSVGGNEKAVGDKITVTANITVTAVWENIPAAPTEYNILDGVNSKWTQDSDGSLSVRGSGAFSEFVGVKVDGKSVDEKYYTVKEGSTIVTLKAGYLNTLTGGSHTLEIIWTNGSASTAFTVNAKAVVDNDTKSPQIGDNIMMALWIAVLFVSGIGVMGTTIYIRKKKYSVK